MADLKTKHLLLGQQPPCTHQGYLVPTLTIPQVIDVTPPAPPAPEKAGLFKKEKPPEKMLITIHKTVEILCVRCNAVIKIGHVQQPPTSEPAPVAPPHPGKVVQP